MSKNDQFIKIFELPPAMHPYIDLIATAQEIDLVVGLGSQALNVREISEMMQVSKDEAGHIVKNAYKRDLLKQVVQGEQLRYGPGKFYANLDYLSAYDTGTWLRLPGNVKKEVGQWQIDEFIKMWKPAIMDVVKNPDTWTPIKNRDVLLLEQVLEMVDVSEHICLLPCQCKTTLCPGSPVIEGSMRLGERARSTLEKGQGISLTVEKAKTHLINLDRMGLVHTGPRQWRKNDPGLEWVSHGNCHPSYSFPFLAGSRMGLEKKYPRAYYAAEIEWDQCSHCGLCVARCPFGAFYQDGKQIRVDGQVFRQVSYDENLCWGCGLCANSCPEKAIKMTPLG